MTASNNNRLHSSRDCYMCVDESGVNNRLRELQGSCYMLQAAGGRSEIVGMFYVKKSRLAYIAVLSEFVIFFSTLRC